jgi:hypothetical protein
MSLECLKDTVKAFWDSFPDLYLADLGPVTNDQAPAGHVNNVEELEDSMTQNLAGSMDGFSSDEGADGTENDDAYSHGEANQLPDSKPVAVMAVKVFRVCFQKTLLLVEPEQDRVEAKTDFLRYAAAIRDSLQDVQVNIDSIIVKPGRKDANL